MSSALVLPPAALPAAPTGPVTDNTVTAAKQNNNKKLTEASKPTKGSGSPKTGPVKDFSKKDDAKSTSSKSGGAESKKDADAKSSSGRSNVVKSVTVEEAASSSNDQKNRKRNNRPSTNLYYPPPMRSGGKAQSPPPSSVDAPAAESKPVAEVKVNKAPESKPLNDKTENNNRAKGKAQENRAADKNKSEEPHPAPPQDKSKSNEPRPAAPQQGKPEASSPTRANEPLKPIQQQRPQPNNFPGNSGRRYSQNDDNTRFENRPYTTGPSGGPRPYGYHSGNSQRNGNQGPRRYDSSRRPPPHHSWNDDSKGSASQPSDNRNASSQQTDSRIFANSSDNVQGVSGGAHPPTSNGPVVNGLPANIKPFGRPFNPHFNANKRRGGRGYRGGGYGGERRDSGFSNRSAKSGEGRPAQSGDWGQLQTSGGLVNKDIRTENVAESKPTVDEKEKSAASKAVVDKVVADKDATSKIVDEKGVAAEKLPEKGIADKASLESVAAGKQACDDLVLKVASGKNVPELRESQNPVASTTGKYNKPKDATAVATHMQEKGVPVAPQLGSTDVYESKSPSESLPSDSSHVDSAQSFNAKISASVQPTESSVEKSEQPLVDNHAHATVNHETASHSGMNAMSTGNAMHNNSFPLEVGAELRPDSFRRGAAGEPAINSRNSQNSQLDNNSNASRSMWARAAINAPEFRPSRHSAPAAPPINPAGFMPLPAPASMGGYPMSNPAYPPHSILSTSAPFNYHTPPPPPAPAPMTGSWMTPSQFGFPYPTYMCPPPPPGYTYAVQVVLVPLYAQE